VNGTNGIILLLSLTASGLILCLMDFCPQEYSAIDKKRNMNLIVVMVSPLTLGLGDGGDIYILSPERQPNKELKYRISTKVHQRIFTRDWW